MQAVRYSIIVPVYNRPEEVEELLLSLTNQVYKNFEVIIVEDGSTRTCKKVVDIFAQHLSTQYLFKNNSGPGPSRNAGFALAKGDYFIVFDSDCIIPENYLSIVEQDLKINQWDAWGGPDKAHRDFTPIQQAMGYTMSSVLTTGGIRGGKQSVGWFQPRSFNMGLSRKAYEVTGGFKFDRFAEDIELSIRMKENGLRVGLIADAFVYHKRRTNLKQFFKQVFNFGKGRVLIGKLYPSEVKLTHWVPTIFTLGILFWLFTALVHFSLFKLGALAFSFYLSAILLHGTYTYKNLLVGILAVPSALTQLTGYGLGFIFEKFK